MALLIWSGPGLPGMKPTWSLCIHFTIKVESLFAKKCYQNFEIIVNKGNWAVITDIIHIFSWFRDDGDKSCVNICPREHPPWGNLRTSPQREPRRGQIFYNNKPKTHQDLELSLSDLVTSNISSREIGLSRNSLCSRVILGRGISWRNDSNLLGEGVTVIV